MTLNELFSFAQINKHIRKSINNNIMQILDNIKKNEKDSEYGAILIKAFIAKISKEDNTHMRNIDSLIQLDKEIKTPYKYFLLMYNHNISIPMIVNIFGNEDLTNLSDALLDYYHEKILDINDIKWFSNIIELASSNDAKVLIQILQIMKIKFPSDWTLRENLRVIFNGYRQKSLTYEKALKNINENKRPDSP
jgi:hypothetical protein